MLMSAAIVECNDFDCDNSSGSSISRTSPRPILMVLRVSIGADAGGYGSANAGVGSARCLR